MKYQLILNGLNELHIIDSNNKPIDLALTPISARYAVVDKLTPVMLDLKANGTICIIETTEDKKSEQKSNIDLEKIERERKEKEESQKRFEEEMKKRAEQKAKEEALELEKAKEEEKKEEVKEVQEPIKSVETEESIIVEKDYKKRKKKD